MSRIGKKPIEIPAGVKVEVKGQNVAVSGAKGKLEMACHPRIKVSVDSSAGRILVENEHPDNRMDNQLHGTMRSLIANMVTGVEKGFEQKLEIYGTGFNVKEEGGKLIMNVGYCHPVELPIPDGVKVTIDVPATKGNEVPAKFGVSSADKCILGQFASDIRKSKPPEPYKGKGVRFAGEYIRRKEGKAFASGS
ncbi:MAG: 50S ribosomal protein L6 [Candidatus Brocadiia bacterium]|nr:MAG: 50S ribosomal protein L6 [Candidatus Brocadiia bacterium]